MLSWHISVLQLFQLFTWWHTSLLLPYCFSLLLLPWCHLFSLLHVSLFMLPRCFLLLFPWWQYFTLWPISSLVLLPWCISLLLLFPRFQLFTKWLVSLWFPWLLLFPCCCLLGGNCSLGSTSLCCLFCLGICSLCWFLDDSSLCCCPGMKMGGGSGGTSSISLSLLSLSNISCSYSLAFCCFFCLDGLPRGCFSVGASFLFLDLTVSFICCIRIFLSSPTLRRRVIIWYKHCHIPTAIMGTSCSFPFHLAIILDPTTGSPSTGDAFISLFCCVLSHSRYTKVDLVGILYAKKTFEVNSSRLWQQKNCCWRVMFVLRKTYNPPILVVLSKATGCSILVLK